MTSVVWQLITLLLVVAVVLEGLVLIGVMRQLGGILVRLSPSRPGEIEGGPDPGAQVALPEMDPTQPAVLLFVSGGCSLCEILIPAVPAVVRNYSDVQFGVVPREPEVPPDSVIARLGSLARPDLSPLHDEWNIRGTPYAVGVDRHGVVVKQGVVNNLEHLEALTEVALTHEPHARDHEHPELESVHMMSEVIPAPFGGKDGNHI